VAWWRDLQDLPANVLFFIPVGYLSARCRRSPPHHRRPIGLHAKQQLEFDNAQLKASNASLEQELKISRLYIGTREADVAARTKELSDARGSQTRLEARHTQLTTRLKEVVAKYKETARTVQELEASKELMEREVKLAREELAQAQEKNQAMYQVSSQVLEHFKRKPRWTALLQKEPFTGIKQVEVESSVEAYERALEDQLISPEAGAAP
jgi:chromosome segregation ATPase